MYSGASVAQSSAEYWEANADAEVAELDVNYGNCIMLYDTAADAASVCAGVKAQPIPTAFYLQTGCNYRDVRQVIGYDVAGFVGGAITGAFATPPAAIFTGLVGGVGGSAGEMAWQGIEILWCKYHSSGDKTRPQQTGRTPRGEE